MIGLCDCNNFFVSCERVFNPSLNRQPVVVLSNNDGCVISRSNEAKAIGVKMGHPFYQIKELVEEKRVHVFSSNYQLYGDMSSRVMSTLRNHVSGLEIYSIDEAFFTLEDCSSETSLEAFGHTLSHTIYRSTGIPVSIGIAPSKTLAKLAAERCKKDSSLQGAYLMKNPSEVLSLSIDQVWGIGRRLGKMLQEEGIYTIGSFLQMSSGWVKSRMGISGIRTREELKGNACIELEHIEQNRQQICNSRSFARDLEDPNEIRRAVVIFATQCAEKLREEHGVCSQVTTFLYTNKHHDDEPQYGNSRMIQLNVSTDSTTEIVQAATAAFSAIYKSQFKYKKAGVILSRIDSNEAIQTSLFDTTDRPAVKRLMEALDKINRDNGKESVVLASHGTTPLQVNRNRVSDHYTTKWEEIITVKV